MLIEQIDNIGPESLERGFSNFFDVLWPAIEADLLAFRTKFKSELGGDHHSFTHRSQSFADELFVGERAVNFSGIEECDAAFNCRPKKRDHLLLICRWAVAKTHSHTPEPDSRDF